jgi:ABC-type Mn2+/Zn2+ transport system ATPase subunit
VRITQVQIDQWRCFENLTIPFPDDAPLICLVGENGTGKSSILELIRHALVAVGLQGSSTGVGFVPQQILAPGDRASVGVDLRGTTREAILHHALTRRDTDEDLTDEQIQTLVHEKWNGHIDIELSGDSSAGIQPGGIADGSLVDELSRMISYALRKEMLHPRGTDRFLFLGPDRWSPHSVPNAAQAPDEHKLYEPLVDVGSLVRHWVDQLGYSYAAERADWERGALAAVRQKTAPPPEPGSPVPHVPLLTTLLPYLQPHSISISQDGLPEEAMFQSRERLVPFSALSSGEKDIVTMAIAQSELSPGHSLVLFDEPELHINPQLVRDRLAVIKDHGAGSQIIIATHSLEAVEVAGQQYTIWLRRSEPGGAVDIAALWNADESLGRIGAELGMPAFSYTNRTFIAVEGKRGPKTNYFFDAAGGDTMRYRFIGMESCEQVRSFLDEVTRSSLPAFLNRAEPHQELTVGGVIDRDHRSQQAVDDLEQGGRLHVWRCTDEENLFLQPEAMQTWMTFNGYDDEPYLELLLRMVDQQAATWIRHQAERNYQEITGQIVQIRENSTRTWDRIKAGQNQWIADVVRRSRSEGVDDIRLTEVLKTATEQYATIRSPDRLWRCCRGKDTLKAVARQFNGVGATQLSDAILGRWRRGELEWPEPVYHLRRWLATVPQNPRSRRATS